MAITQAVIDYDTPGFRAKTRLAYWTVANNILDGQFPTNVTSTEDKNKTTVYASRLIRQGEDIHSLGDSILCVPAVQDLINATPQGDVDAVLSTHVKKQFKMLAGCYTIYT